MFSKVKSAFFNVVGSFDTADGGTIGSLGPAVTAQHTTSASISRSNSIGQKEKTLRFPYIRPYFLQLNSDEEILVTADHTIRPIICPRDISRLPWNSGYAETINAGKSKRNEDQSSIHVGLLTRCINKSSINAKESNKKIPLVHESAINGYMEAMAKPASDSQAKTLETTLNPQELDSLHGKHGDQELPKPNLFQRGSRPSHRSHFDGKGQLMIYLPYYYFGVFDGHAGWGAAVSASNQLHHIIHEKLCDVIELILPDLESTDVEKSSGPFWYSMEKSVTPDNAIIGALEQAFWIMDKQIGEDRLKYQLTGGCTACIGLFILGKLYVANAGDSRAVLGLNAVPHPMSFDFTPETETQRIRKLGALHPELLGGEFTHLEFMRRPLKRDLGKKAIYRDHYMSGWAYKTIKQDDLKYPLVCGEGKRSRVLATIGVTRGFGDHDLRAQFSSIPIKPFLSPEPEVRVFDLNEVELTDRDVLILATDGLWDITSNDKAVDSVCNSLDHFPPEDFHRYKYRYTSAAQDLVMGSRGKLKEHNWRTADDKHATIDDISNFVIPLKPYQEEYSEWLSQYNSLIKEEAAFTSKLLSDLAIEVAVPATLAYPPEAATSGEEKASHPLMDVQLNSEKMPVRLKDEELADNRNELERERKVLCLERSLGEDGQKEPEGDSSTTEGEPENVAKEPLPDPTLTSNSHPLAPRTDEEELHQESDTPELSTQSHKAEIDCESATEDASSLLYDELSDSQKGFLLVADISEEPESERALAKEQDSLDPVEDYFQDCDTDKETTTETQMEFS